LFAGAANQDGMKISSIAVCALLGSIINVPAGAANPVKIGVIYPLTGNAASAGASAKDAVELAAEIVNTAHPGWRVSMMMMMMMMMVARAIGSPASFARRQRPSSSAVSLLPASLASVSHAPSSEILAGSMRGYPAAARLTDGGR
jgi:hypothetical protein